MTDSTVWRELIEWATALPKAATLRLNDAHTEVYLEHVSYGMAQNLEALTRSTGRDRLLVDLYLWCRDRALKEIAVNSSLPYFHSLPYDRTAYRGPVKMESRSMLGYVQPLGDALIDYVHQQEAGGIMKDVEPVEDVQPRGATQPSSKPTRSPRRGPRPNYMTATLVAEVILQSGGGNWRNRLDDICYEMDEKRLPCPKTWKKRGYRDWCDCLAQERNLVVKAISHHLKVAQRDPKTIS